MVFSFLPYGLDFSLDGPPGETSSCQQPQKKGAYNSFGWAVSYQRAVALHYTCPFVSYFRKHLLMFPYT